MARTRPPGSPQQRPSRASTRTRNRIPQARLAASRDRRSTRLGPSRRQQRAGHQKKSYRFFAITSLSNFARVRIDSSLRVSDLLIAFRLIPFATS